MKRASGRSKTASNKETLHWVRCDGVIRRVADDVAMAMKRHNVQVDGIDAEAVGRVIQQLAYHGESVCVVCGCSDSRACPGGCSWTLQFAKTKTGVCSRCWPAFMRKVDQV